MKQIIQMPLLLHLIPFVPLMLFPERFLEEQKQFLGHHTQDLINPF